LNELLDKTLLRRKIKTRIRPFASKWCVNGSSVLCAICVKCCSQDGCSSATLLAYVCLLYRITGLQWLPIISIIVARIQCKFLLRVPIAQHGLAPGYLCKLMCKSLSASTVLLVRYALLIIMICLFPGPALSTSLTSSLSCFCIPAPCFCSRDSWVLHFVMTFLRHFEA